MMLVRPNLIPPSTLAELERLQPDRIVVLGGPASVNPSVFTQLQELTNGTVTRIGGATRYEVSAELSEVSYPNGASRAYVSTGQNFPDALAASPVAGLNKSPLLLVQTNSVPAAVMAELERLDVDEIVILGGTGSVSLAVEAQLATLGPVVKDVPADRLDYMNSTAGSAWANTPSGEVTTGLDEVDFWIGGLAEALDPFGGMLGSTFNFVFEQQMEDLQFADRFYYLFRNQGNQLFAALEANSFTDLIQRNTDASLLPANIFAIQDPYFDLEDLPATLPAGLASMLDGTYRWDGDEHIEIHGSRTGDDFIRGGQGDDALWGYGGNDRIQGGSGNDSIIGGDGDDILTDTFGDDNIKGGLGNDAINGGAGEDLILSSHGDDFVVGGTENLTTIFSGTGDDVIRGGLGSERVFGGEGDDWIEGGAGADLVQGDNANQFQNDPNGGNDIVIGGTGNDDIEGEGGHDILVGQSHGVDRHEGQLGYDWVSYYGTHRGVDADLRFTVMQRPDVQAVRDRFDLIEALSGGVGDDVLRGMNAEADDIPDEDVPRHKMTQESMDLIANLEALLRPGAGHEDYALRFMDNPLQPDVDGVSNMLIGGPGNDVIEGRGGDDFIDGDVYLKVQLEVNGERYDRAEDFRLAVFTGEINPGDINIIREIANDAESGDVDTAVYGQSMLDYTIVDLGDGYTRVEHTNVVELEEGEGFDVIRNIEMLQFSDGCIVLATGEQCETFGSVSFGGQIDPPTESLPLTATVAFDPEFVVNPTNIRFTWQIGEVGEGWDPSLTGDNLPDGPNGRVDTFTPSGADSSNILRVIVTYTDDNGQQRTIVSEALPEILNINNDPTTPVLTPDAPQVGDGISISGFTDADGLEEATEAGITYEWQSSDDGFATFDVIQPTTDITPLAYLVQPADVGKQIRVMVSYTDDQGQAEVVYSTITAAVPPEAEPEPVLEPVVPDPNPELEPEPVPETE
jgi:Ca2+-binding RTX toxin-like protein